MRGMNGELLSWEGYLYSWKMARAQRHILARVDGSALIDGKAPLKLGLNQSTAFDISR